MYTLVSSSVLALDLARHPHGAAVADVVDRALSLDRLDPPTAHDGLRQARDRLALFADAAPRVSEALWGVSSAALGGLEPARVAEASQRLQSALMGRLEDLLALLRDQLAREGLPQGAVDVVLDRVVSAWTSTDGDADDVWALRAAWDHAVADLPPPPTPPAVRTAGLLDLLEAVARSTRVQWLALDVAHEQQHRGASWSLLLHEASRAAVELDRTVEVTRWQLSAVRAAHASGHALTTCAPGAMMSVVAAVQALCVQDVVAPAVADGLLGPCRAVLLPTG